jgi:hypothetical protein
VPPVFLVLALRGCEKHCALCQVRTDLVQLRAQCGVLLSERIVVRENLIALNLLLVANVFDLSGKSLDLCATRPKVAPIDIQNVSKYDTSKNGASHYTQMITSNSSDQRVVTC